MRALSPASDRYRGKWRGILAALGVPAKVLNGKNQPCPFCDGKDRFRWTNHNDDGSYFCSRCEPGDGLEFVQKFLKVSFKEAVAKIDAIVGTVPVISRPTGEAARQIEAMRNLWESGRRVTDGDPVGLYLRNRGFLGEFPKSIKYVERMKHEQGIAPGMVCRVVDADDLGANVHRTWLTLDGHKAPFEPNRKIMAGSLPDGCAIRLGKPAGVLGIAEGIETALMASQRFGLPVWSVISEGGMRKFRPPLDVTEFHIFGDNDRNHVGQAAAFQAAKDIGVQWQREGLPISISVHIPERTGSDWADTDTAHHAHAIRQAFPGEFGPSPPVQSDPS